MKKILITGILLLVLLASCRMEKQKPVRIGINPWPPCEIWYIAEEMGFFNTTPVEIVRFTTWSDNMDSLYKGNVNLTHSTYFNSVYYHDKGVEGKIILSTDTIAGSDGFVIKKERLDNKDLSGITIAVEINTDEHFLLKKALDSMGMKEEDVVIRSATSAEASELFINKSVDACFTYEPFLSQAAESGEGEIVWTTMDLPGYMTDVLVADVKTIRKREKDLENIITAWYMAQKYIRENPDKAFPVMAEKEKMGTGDYYDFYNAFTFFSPEENTEIFSSEEFRNKLDEMDSFLMSHSAISINADTEKLFYPDIIFKVKEKLDEK